MTHSAKQALDVTAADLDLYSIIQREVDIGANALEAGDAEIAVTMFQSALAKLTPEQPFRDHLVHNLFRAYRLLIEQLFKIGDPASASVILNSVLDLQIEGEMSGDLQFRRQFAGGFQDLSILFFANKQFDASVACCRKANEVHRSPGGNVNLGNALAAGGQRAVLKDFTDEVTSEQLGRHIFIACVPKCASTFLKNVLVGLTGYRDVFMVSSAGQTEHEIYLPTLLETANFDTVTQQHCRASDANIQLMEAFEIRPVVLVRNIFDAVMSLLDFYDSGAYRNTYFRTDYPALDRETKIDLLIDNVIPWYFQFLASWSNAEKEEKLEVFWLSYEDLIADKAKGIKDVLRFYGLGAKHSDIEQGIAAIESEKRKTRFNKGVAGRGDAGLSDGQKERIRSLARCFPTTDFGRFGL